MADSRQGRSGVRHVIAPGGKRQWQPARYQYQKELHHFVQLPSATAPYHSQRLATAYLPKAQAVSPTAGDVGKPPAVTAHSYGKCCYNTDRPHCDPEQACFSRYYARADYTSILVSLLRNNSRDPIGRKDINDICVSGLPSVIINKRARHH